MIILNRKIKRDVQGFAQLVPMILAIVICFAILFIGIFVNGEINQNLIDTYGTNNATGGEDWRTAHENTTINRMGNVSTNQDSAIDIVQVVIIITVLAAAIAAIFLFTRFR